MQRSTSAGLIGLLLLAAGCAPHPAADVPFLVTPPEIVAGMLRLARAGPGDVVYDLGSGDGRIVIAAIRDFRAERAVGIEIDPALVGRSRAYARRAGVADRAIFVEQDLFQADLSPATVVTLYLTREVNLRLRPKLERELAPGTRVVSFNFDMGEWEPTSVLRLDVRGRAIPVYLWVVPPRRPAGPAPSDRTTREPDGAHHGNGPRSSAGSRPRFRPSGGGGSERGRSPLRGSQRLRNSEDLSD